MKSKKIILVISLIVLSLTVSCEKNKTAAGSAAPSRPLRVGMMPSAVGAPVQYALEKGFFTNEGITVTPVVFPNGAAINEAVVAGELDVAMSGAATIFSLATGDCKLLADIAASGGMGIWARNTSSILSVRGQASEAKEMYGSVDTIRRKTFFATLGTSSQFNVLRYLQQFGLTENDINFVHMDSPAATQAFVAGEGDAIASMPPYTTQIEAEGGVKICTFEEATGTALYDMMFAPNTIVNSRRADLVKFVRAVERAIEDMSDNALRQEFTLPWFRSEGKEYTEEAMAQEILDRQYCNRATMTSGDYVFGAAMIGYGEYNVSIERLEPEQVDNIRNCFDPTILEEAVGFDVKIPGE
jgi:ABC-type nitrate/sulfonate/bicarbonate transport system substrate-binding protein